MTNPNMHQAANAAGTTTRTTPSRLTAPLSPPRRHRPRLGGGTSTSDAGPMGNHLPYRVPLHTLHPQWDPTVRTLDFWMIPQRTLTTLDRTAHRILSALQARARADPGVFLSRDVVDLMTSVEAQLPRMVTTHRYQKRYATRHPSDQALVYYRQEYFRHLPTSAVNHVKFAWTLGDGSCLINAVLLSVNGTCPTPDAAHPLGCHTLRLATLAHAITHQPDARRISGSAEAYTDMLLHLSTPHGYLGQSALAIIAKVIDRDIWLISPQLRVDHLEITAGCGTHRRLSDTVDPDPLLLTWCKYLPDPRHLRHPSQYAMTAESPAVHAYNPREPNHFSACLYDNLSDISALQPADWPSWLPDLQTRRAATRERLRLQQATPPHTHTPHTAPIAHAAPPAPHPLDPATPPPTAPSSHAPLSPPATSMHCDPAPLVLSSRIHTPTRQPGVHTDIPNAPTHVLKDARTADAPHGHAETPVRPQPVQPSRRPPAPETPTGPAPTLARKPTTLHPPTILNPAAPHFTPVQPVTPPHQRQPHVPNVSTTAKPPTDKGRDHTHRTPPPRTHMPRPPHAGKTPETRSRHPRRFSQTSILPHATRAHKRQRLPPPPAPAEPYRTTAQHTPTPCSSPATGEQLVLLTHNCRGLKTNKEDVLAMLHKHAPHLAVLTETHTCPKQHSSRFARSGYTNYNSKLSSNHDRRGGILLLVNETIRSVSTIRYNPDTPADMHGYILHFVITMPSSNPLEVIGTYIPQNDSTNTRGKVLQYITNATRHSTHTVILMGDLNATLYAHGRTPNNQYTQDTATRIALAGAGYTTPHKPDTPIYTYTSESSQCRSHIDHVLVKSDAEPVRPNIKVDNTPVASDHAPLIATIPATSLKITIPLDPTNNPTTILRIRKPPTDQQMSDLRTTIMADLGHDILAASTCLDNGKPLGDVLTSIQSISLRIQQDIFPRCLDTIRVTQGKRRRYRPKIVDKKRTSLLLLKQRLLAIHDRTQPIHTLVPTLAHAMTTLLGHLPPSTSIQQALHHITHKRNIRDKRFSDLRMHSAIQALEQLMDTKPKSAHTWMRWDPDKPDTKPLITVKQTDALGQPTGTTTSYGPDVVHEVDTYFEPLLSPPKDTMPVDSPYPFSLPDAPDPIQLQPGTPDGDWIDSYLRDFDNFARCARSLASNKATGPDTILNEVLKYAPPEYLSLIHRFLIKMSTEQDMPGSLADSITILLYKKDDPTDISNYRPIGLANSLCKLWTKMLAWATSDYSEARGILNNGQAGFRPGYYTHLHTQQLTYALEDAKIHKKDIHMLQVDFTNAFNRVHHDKLFRIMHNLGYPPSLITHVRQLYSSSATRFRTPHGDTTHRPVRRGTIQGDSLSPILFAIYIEPLLRWLHEGGRGYSPTGTAPDHRLSNLTYADDLCILARTASDLAVQARKVTEYSKWADLAPNLRKSFASCILHYSAARQGPTSAAGLAMSRGQLSRRIPLAGGWAQYSPPTSPFTYLGVTFTLNLDWSHHKTQALLTCTDLCQKVQRSPFTPQQKLLTLHRLIKRKVAYAFPAVPYSPNELNKLDTEITKVTRAAYGVHNGMPVALMRDAKQRFGLDCPSIAAIYAQDNIKHLIWSLSHPSPISQIARQALYQQLSYAALSQDPDHAAVVNLSRARQYMLLTGTHPLTLLKDGEPFSIPEAPSAALFRDALKADSLTHRFSLSLPMHRLKPLWSLLPDPSSLFIANTTRTSVSLIDETALRKHLPHTFGKPQAIAHRLLSQLLCMGGSPIDPHSETWPLDKPLTSTQLTLRDEPARIVARHLADPGTKPPSLATTVPDLLERVSRTGTARVLPPVQPSIDPPAAPAVRTAPLEHRGHITQLLNQHPHLTSRRQAYLLLQRNPPPGKKTKQCQKAWTLAILTYIYGQDDTVVEVHRSSTYGPKHARQSQILVQWSPSVIDRWALPVFRSLDYHDATTSTATHDPWANKCALCADGDHHHNCAPVPPAKKRRTRSTAALSQIEPVDLIRVEWAPRWEPLDNIIAEGYSALVRDMHTLDAQRRHDDLSRAPRPTPMGDRSVPTYTAEVPAQVRTQPTPNLHTPANPMWRDMLSKVRTSTVSTMPQLDILLPTHATQHSLARQPLTVARPRPHSPPTTHHVQTISVHRHDGSTLGTLSPASVRTLYAKYKATKLLTGTANPRSDPRAFPDEIALLLRRNPPGQNSLDHSITSPHVLKELATAFSLEHDRFTHPLHPVCHIHHTWSPHACDRVFGSHHDAYSELFTGSSWCFPPQDPVSQYRTLRWAILSAKSQTRPTLTLVLLQHRPGTSFERLLSQHPHYACTAMRIKKNAHILIHPESLHHDQPRSMPTKQPLHLIIAANAAGWTRYKPACAAPTLVGQLVAAMRQTYTQQPAHPIAWDTQLLSEWAPHPGSDNALPPFLQTRMPVTYTPIHSTHGDLDPPGTLLNPCNTHNDDEVVYTDGSLKAGSPDSPAPSGAAAIWHTHGHHTILPPGSPSTNQVNRAELSGIAWAVKHLDHPVIATDSLNSICQIRSYLRNPGRMRLHPQHDLLCDIATSLVRRTSRGLPTHIVKVKAHTGIHGNEHADFLASQTAGGVPPTDQLAITPTPPPFWPAHETEPLLNLGKSLSKFTDKKHRLGLADTNTTYYTAYIAIADTSHAASHHFITCRTLPWAAIRLALRYRGGGIFNQKLAVRYGLSTSLRCPVCHKPDSQSHILGGCLHKRLHAQYCKRHNQAGRLIAKALLHSVFGAGIIQADVGRDPHLVPELQHVPRDVPTPGPDPPAESGPLNDDDDHLSDAGSCASDLTDLGSVGASDTDEPSPTERLTRPDITLVTRDAKGTINRMYLIEVKFGPDTRLESKIPPAAAKLAHLQEALSQHYKCPITPMVVLVGVGGRIPSSTHATLAHLLSGSNTLNALLNDLNRLAVSWLHSIVSARRQLEPD